MGTMLNIHTYYTLSVRGTDWGLTTPRVKLAHQARETLPAMSHYSRRAFDCKLRSETAKPPEKSWVYNLTYPLCLRQVTVSRSEANTLGWVSSQRRASARVW